MISPVPFESFPSSPSTSDSIMENVYESVANDLDRMSISDYGSGSTSCSGRTTPTSRSRSSSTSSQSSGWNSNMGAAYVQLRDRIHSRIQSGDTPFFSFEFFPPKTKEGATNLISRLDHMKRAGPLFIDITWHAAGNPGSDSETSSLTIAGVALNYCGIESLLHVTCIGLTEEALDAHLERAKKLGIRNIMALRGDMIHGMKTTRFKYAVDVVRYIRAKYDDYFTIAVAGYPTGHPQADSYENDLRYLKAKVDAGADFIVTQLFFNTGRFLKFVEDCRKIGITVPILAGIMPIQSYDSLRHMVKLSQLKVPPELTSTIESIKNNDEAILKYGIDYATDMCKELLYLGKTVGLHFYTLNREVATTQILKNLGLWGRTSISKPLPWPAPANYKRCLEDVRPIFWASRPKSYAHRTKTWDEFPNGRWGNAASPAFGDLKDYYLFLKGSKFSQKQLKQMWGENIQDEDEIFEIFYCYLSGRKNRFGHKVQKLPWNEDDELRPETNVIKRQLAYVNQRGVLTINSQPNVNGAPSTHPVYGWGSPGGYVYQKAYLEFFTSPENVEALRRVLPSYPRVHYHMMNSSGSEEYSNLNTGSPNAVTWGAFPGKEIIQPTVVDPMAFKAWKDEAFGLWRDEWGSLYPEGSASRKVIDGVCESYFLVNLVDNDYIVDTCLFQLLEDMFAVKEC